MKRLLVVCLLAPCWSGVFRGWAQDDNATDSWVMSTSLQLWDSAFTETFKANPRISVEDQAWAPRLYLKAGKTNINFKINLSYRIPTDFSGVRFVNQTANSVTREREELDFFVNYEPSWSLEIPGKLPTILYLDFIAGFKKFTVIEKDQVEFKTTHTGPYAGVNGRLDKGQYQVLLNVQYGFMGTDTRQKPNPDTFFTSPYEHDTALLSADLSVNFDLTRNIFGFIGYALQRYSPKKDLVATNLETSGGEVIPIEIATQTLEGRGFYVGLGYHVIIH